MTIAEFKEKYKLEFDSSIEGILFMDALDKLYLEYTREQAHEILNDFLDHADDFFNEMKENAADSIERLQELFGKDIFEEDDEEELKKFDA